MMSPQMEVVFDHREAQGLAHLADSIYQKPAWGRAFLHPAAMPPEEMKTLPPIEIAELKVPPLEDEQW
jgi:hypothetical protein